MTKARDVVAMIGLGLSSAAHAQQTPPPPSRSDDSQDIVVTGRELQLPPGTPAYGSVTIDRARLNGDASGRVENVLADVAGFQQFRRSDSRSANPSSQGVTLRALGGNASSRALVLLDGVPIADPFFGYIPFNALSPDRLSAVRITRGGGAGAFGGGAVAGTIELVSASRRELDPLVASLFAGSDGAIAVTAGASPQLGGGFASVSGRFERGNGFYTTPFDQRAPSTSRARYRDWSTNLRLVTPLDARSELQFRGSLFGDDRTLRFDGANSVSEGEDASIRVIRRGDWQIDALAYLQARNFANKVISASTYTLTLDQRATPSTGAGGKIELRPPVGRDHVLRVGGDLRIADGRLYENAYAPSGTINAYRTAGGNETTGGLFAEDDWTIGRLVLTGGARIDWCRITDGFFRERTSAGVPTRNSLYPDRFGSTATGRAGALFNFASTITLRAAGYTGYRLPTLNELYRPFVVFPITTQANAGLKPEHLRGAEVGMDLTPSAGVSLNLTAFYNRLGDAIANVTIGPNLRQRQNVRAIVAKGIETTASARLGAVSLDASYALSDAHVEAAGLALDDRAPAESPRHAASATLAYWRDRLAILSATMRYVGKQYDDDLQTDILPSALTFDAVAQYPIARHVAIVARGENLFDARVVTRNQGGSVDLGTPRTLWIGVKTTY